MSKGGGGKREEKARRLTNDESRRGGDTRSGKSCRSHSSYLCSRLRRGRSRETKRMQAKYCNIHSLATEELEGEKQTEGGTRTSNA